MKSLPPVIPPIFALGGKLHCHCSKKCGNRSCYFYFLGPEISTPRRDPSSLNHELAASRQFLPEDKLSPDVQKIYQSYLQRLEKPAKGPVYPHGLGILSKLAFYLAWVSFWLQVAFFAMLAVFAWIGAGEPGVLPDSLSARCYLLLTETFLPLPLSILLKLSVTESVTLLVFCSAW